MARKGHLLVIDDQESICGMLSEYFHKHGFDVTTSLSGMDGVSMIDESHFDLVVLDIALGDSDGLELLEVIKRRQPQLPVLMLTGLGYDEELVLEARQKRASGYISKNLPLEQLLMEVRHVLKSPAAPMQAPVH
jgi:DNA-binding response OmpR family regulator